MREKVTSIFFHPMVGLTLLVAIVFTGTFFVQIEEADAPLPQVGPPPATKVYPVVVALKHISPNTRLTPALVKTEFRPETSLGVAERLPSEQEVMGLMTKSAIITGQIILSSMLNPPHEWGQNVYPATDGNLIFYTQQQQLYAVNSQTGEEIWRFIPRGDDQVLTSPPVAAGGFAYYALVYPNYGSNYVQTRLYAIDTQTGRVRWSFTHQNIAERADVPPLAPVVGDGLVGFVGWGNKDLYVFHAEIGYKKWHFRSEALISSPGLADGTVSFISGDGYLYSLDAETGREKWRVEQYR